MINAKPTLHLFCGKIAAGKSSLADEVAKAPLTILIREDFWLSRLFGPEIRDFDDYIRRSRQLVQAMGPHVEHLLRAGVSVALDYPANTPAYRAWMRGLAVNAGARCLLHFLDAPEELCRRRLRERNARGEHEFAASDAEFDLISSYFVAPREDEGFDMVRHGGGADD